VQQADKGCDFDFLEPGYEGFENAADGKDVPEIH